MNIEPIISEELRKQIAEIRKKLFVYEALGEIYFTNNIDCKALIYPITSGAVLNKIQVLALSKAIRTTRDDLVYLSLLERSNSAEHIEDWEIPLDNFETYISFHSPHTVLENVLYSPSGKWGVGLTLDNFGVIGGSNEFCQCFFREIGEDTEKVTRKFIDDSMADKWINKDVVRKILINFYGLEKGQQFLYNRA
jgi:hypothetical protein